MQADKKGNDEKRISHQGRLAKQLIANYSILFVKFSVRYK